VIGSLLYQVLWYRGMLAVVRTGWHSSCGCRARVVLHSGAAQTHALRWVTRVADVASSGGGEQVAWERSWAGVRRPPDPVLSLSHNYERAGFGLCVCGVILTSMRKRVVGDVHEGRHWGTSAARRCCRGSPPFHVQVPGRQV
jgi:hypothetical protein